MNQITSFISTHGEQDLSLRVISRKQISENVIEFVFACQDDAVLPNWTPGSHVELLLPNGLRRQYSLIPDEHQSAFWKIAVLIETQGRGGSTFLEQNVVEGSLVPSKGPRNHFEFVQSNSYHFVAGGIGITPLISMIELAENSGADWSLSFLGKSIDRMPYLQDLRNKFSNKITVFSKSDGQKYSVTEDLSKLPDQVHIYCCGPERLMDEVENFMVEAGKPDFVHIERFSPRITLNNNENHPITVYCQKSDVVILVPEDESILMAADFEGIETTGDCMEGTCGSCETRVISGIPDHRDSIIPKAARHNSETMMICVSRAIGTQLTLDL